MRLVPRAQWLVAAGCVSSVAVMAQEARDIVRPFLEKHCIGCHNPGLPSGSVDLRQLLEIKDSLSSQKPRWELVASVIQTNRMPPPNLPRPPLEAAKAVHAALMRELANARPLAKAPPPPPPPATNDWLTYGYDPERTGWNRAEKTLNRENAGKLRLLWRTQLDAVPNRVNLHSTITDPLVVENVATKQGPKTVLFIASAENNVYALDAVQGGMLWKRSFPNATKPPQAASGNCPNNLNATPVIDRQKSIVYFVANDGNLRGLNLADGEDRFPASRVVPAYSRNFSLNLIDGVLYTSTTRGCGGAVSEVVGMDVSNADHPVSHFYLSTGKASGPWGRGGIVKSPYGVLAQAADGAYDPAGGRWGNTILSLNRDVRLVDSFTPANEKYLNAKDFDLGSSSPVVFPFDKWTLAAAAAKEGVIYLMDTMNLGGADHRTPIYTSRRYSNDSLTFNYNGMWSVMTTWVDGRGQRWLLAPMYGPPAQATVGEFKRQYGKVVNGSVMAFQVRMENDKPVLAPQWMSADLDLPGVAVPANGVIFVLANGDRAGAALRGPRGMGGFGPGGPGGPSGPGGFRGFGAGRPLPVSEVNPDEPGHERDAAWRASQLVPVEQGGQQFGIRYSGGRDTTHAVLYALDALTGEELYSSGEAIDSWNHYGGVVLSGGRLYLSTYDGRVYAFGLGK